MISLTLFPRSQGFQFTQGVIDDDYVILYHSICANSYVYLFVFLLPEGDEDLDTAVKVIQEKSTDALLSVSNT